MVVFEKKWQHAWRVWDIDIYVRVDMHEGIDNMTRK